MSDSNGGTRHETGAATRRSVLGDAHVDRANAAMTAFDTRFQTMITEGAWGTVWADETLTRRERSLITIALLAALGHHDELVLHLKATANTGATADDIREALMHVAIYGGVPAANSAIKIAKDTLSKMEKPDPA